MSKESTRAPRIADICRRLTAARSIVSIAAQALDHGASNLEIHAADALKPTAESLDEILNEVSALRIASEAQEEAGDEDQPEAHRARAIQAMRTAIDELYAANLDTEAGSDENRRLWKGAADLEDVLGMVEGHAGATPEDSQ